MNKLTQWAINKTKNNGWNIHKYHSFLENSTQEEFTKSQVPFYFAVEVFPRALALLASKIETSENRLLIILNLYEEHGEGNKINFHTETFKTFLKAIGWEKDFFRNPYIDEWIYNLLNNEYNDSEYATYLAGIEYAYALISDTISKHIEKFNLKCEQIHYKKHAILDWEHGDELLDVALNIDNNEEHLKTIFIKAQKEFLNLYNHLIFPTFKEIDKISKEVIAFYYLREDYSLELNILNNQKNKSNILMIASGGESLIEYLGQTKESSIDVIDMNINQINLCKEKIEILLENKFYSNKEVDYAGKFEKLFALIREYLEEDIYNFSLDDIKDKLEFVVSNIFSNSNLMHIFGENATKYSSDDFGLHFFNVFSKSLKMKDIEFTNKNINNILGGVDINLSNERIEHLKNNYNKHTINWYNTNFIDFDTDKNYDLITISNIGDWMPIDEFRHIIQKLVDKTNQGGSIIVRKLLGDYNLYEEMKRFNLEIRNEQDNSFFYSETYICTKT
ncbi:DUF3419 family protein [Aliarcobacter butzleri]|uniref:DUF3419 family protein n=1 Tax=Aliarcobacter butzleri TaxID=28197 RepID=UPI001EDBD554|nr:DUF3419 family protein [Aliarcobacter butzleri]MCG3692769.1 iron-containing redox enzyme family protein [Aliarcobacter butzleri]